MIKLTEILSELNLTNEGSISRPPGFDTVILEPVETLFESEIAETIYEDNVPDSMTYKIIPDPKDYWSKQKKSTVWDKSSETPYNHNSNKKGGIDDYIKLITKSPKKLLGQNSKIEKSGDVIYNFYNMTLPAFRGLFYDESDGLLKILNVCPNAKQCTQFCYAQKGGYVQFSNSQLSYTKKLNYLFNHWNEFKRQLIHEIESESRLNSKRGVATVVRWHDSGDFLAPEYLEMAYEIARETPKVIHYAYTKMINNVLASNKPKNFTFNFSFGGQEDNLIDTKKHKHARMIPRRLFKGFITKYTNDNGVKTYKFNSAEDFDRFKDAVSKEFGIDKKTIITYDQLMKIPYNKERVKRWNVIVGRGNGDDAAYRNDVLGTYLMEH